MRCYSKQSTVPQFTRLIAMGLTACAFMTNPLFAAPRGRPVIKDGTIKTDDGQILRGMSLHISKSYSSRNLTWGLNINNLIDVREKLHMNCIRLNCLDPRAVHDGRPTSAFATIAEEAYYADSVIANAGAVGLYICLDYHCMGDRGPHDLYRIFLLGGRRQQCDHRRLSLSRRMV